MSKKNLIIAGLIALSLHAALIIMSPNITSEPEVIFKKGESSLKMHLVPSVASTASTKSINDTQKNIQKVEEKIVKEPTPLQKPEQQKIEPVAVKKTVHDIHKVAKKEEEKTVEIPKPVKKTEKLIEEQVKVEEEVVQQEKEITYSTEYFKSDNKNKDKQTQKQKVSANNSKEVIADVKVKGVTIRAKIQNVFKPSYPSSCKRQGHEGTTVLEVTILSKGKRGNIEIIKSAGCKSLDKAAIKALKKAKYIPAKRLGVPFTTTKKFAFNFKLEDQE